MNKLILMPLLLSAACTAADGGPTEMSAVAQSELAEELRGRVAEPAQSCVNQRDLGGNRSVGEGVLIFEGRSRNLIYVNRPVGGCPDLENSRALITRTTSIQLCRGDIATVFDTTSGVEYGGCGLGDFTPYRRVR